MFAFLKGTVPRDGLFKTNIRIIISTVVDVFKVAFYHLIRLLNFYLLLRNYLLKGICVRMNLSQEASSMVLQNHRRLSVSNFNVKNQSPLQGL